MPDKRRRSDLNTLAKSIVDRATDEKGEPKGAQDTLTPSERGRRGGLKGGKARAAKLSPERRSEIAKKAARSRWKAP